jgi:hypothetical protein
MHQHARITNSVKQGPLKCFRGLTRDS